MISTETRVYCLNCRFGEGLVQALLTGEKEPFPCQSCSPWDLEDSRPLSKRPNYQPQSN